MDESRFDHLTRSFAMRHTRRGLLAHLAAMPILGALAAAFEGEFAAAGHGHRHITRHHRRTDRRQERRHDASSEACIPTGQRCPSKKPRGKKGRKLGCNACCQGLSVRNASGKQVCGCLPNGTACTSDTATRCCSGVCVSGACQATASSPPPSPTCASLADGAPCSGGVCCRGVCQACCTSAQCGANQVCLDSGTCQACDVNCTASPCGNLVQDAIIAHPAQHTFVVCPGVYVGSLTLDRDLELIGAGDGADSSTNTILRCALISAVHITDDGQDVALRHLLVDGDGSRGVIHEGAALTMTDCTIINGRGGKGGGLANVGGSSPRTVELIRCTIRDNLTVGDVSPDAGAGLANDAGGQMTLRDCLVTQNTAFNVGGGVYNAGTLTLHHTTVGPNNSASVRGGGIFNDDLTGAVTMDAGSIVCGNAPDQCAGFDDSACNGATCPA